jgi:HK97 family phage portal protein
LRTHKGLRGLIGKAWNWVGDTFEFSGGQFNRIYGGSRSTDSGENVSPESSLRTIVVLRCATLIAGAAASLPIDVFEKRGRDRKPRPDHPVEYLLDSTPNPDMSSMDYRAQQWLSVLLWGNAYSHIVKDGNRPISLWPLQPHLMQLKRNEDTGEIVYLYEIPGKGSYPYRPDEILHTRWFSLDGINGMSAIDQARNGIGLHRVTEKTASKYFKNGMQLNMQLEIPATVKQSTIDQMRDDYTREYSSDNAFRLAIAHSGSKFSPVAINPQDSQFLEQRGYNDVQICMLFGVPPHMVGLTEKSTSWGTGIAEQKQGFLDFTVSPLLTFFEKSYERCLLPKFEKNIYIKHNTKAFLRADAKSRMESYEIAIRSGIKSPNECLALEDENGYEGGDLHVMQAQMTPIELLGKTERLSKPPKTEADANA